MKRFENKVVVITGGSRGIGKSAVVRFLAEGATVMNWDVNEETGEQLRNEVMNLPGKYEFIRVNVSQFDETLQAAAKTAELCGKIDVLVNNAGITRDATLKKMTPEQWQQVIDVNLTGVFNCTKSVFPYMVEQNWGRIINTSSVVGLYGNFGQTNYVATKSGVIGMTKVWARELGRKGITVNAVAPGFIATEMIETVPEKVINMLLDKTPVGRLGKPEDIAAAYAFLASEEASFINGTVLSVDGGLVL
ncbi:MAG: 3-oxoacyl-[acyl-carrier-protein] reductase [Calditrichia bacterium]